MFGIYSNGELIALTEKPRYVYKKQATGVWVEIRDGIAPEALTVNGEIFNLEGKVKVDENARTATVKEVDGSAVLFEQGVKIEQQKADLEYLAIMAGVDLTEGEEEGAIENGDN